MVIASNNSGKINEIKSILNEYELYSLNDKNINIEVEEDQDSFYLNALKKSKEIYNVIKEPVISDDSGLCIEALNDFPGVNTHRFLGPNKTDRERNDEILRRMENIDNRAAKVVCTIVYYDGINIIVGEGIIKGNISKTTRGDNGFGFDEIFEINNKTLAELSIEEKNKISARYLALIDLKNKLKEINY